MEDRFIQIGEDRAKELRKLNPEATLPENLAELCTRWSWDWFIADMSDDYSRTRGEQNAIRNEVHQKLGELNYPYAWR